MTAVPLLDVAGYLDRYLRIDAIPDHDSALNGLQVENSGSVIGFVAAVDASQQTIDRVVEECMPGTMLVVHHGLFWDGNQPVRGRRYRRLRALLDHDVAVYAAHIPLDVHPDIGNNAILARTLGIADAVPFDEYRGVPFGASGSLIMPRDALVARLAELLHTTVQLVAGGPETTMRVGVITGAAGNRVPAAFDAGLDTFITGEGAHHTVFDALELGINLVYAGHYATETVGVQALGRHLAEQFHVPWVFHDHPTGR
ncbi:MAG TPA: Nif3-like dinuclear metal center hexameric protein [Gemmatimonadales bacterium]|jgi:dinuclear metal center YbgI/SA1388 family protein